MHTSTFEYLQPTKPQVETMQAVREATRIYANVLDAAVLDGPDKTYLMRKLREVAMWANVSITRQPDGSPRSTDGGIA